MLKLSSTKKKIKVISDQIGGPTSARAIANVCVEIANQLQINPSKSGVFNFCGDPIISWSGFARHIFKKTNLKIDINEIPTSSYPSVAKRPLNSSMDCKKIYDTFKIKQPNWKDDLDDVLGDLGVLIK